MTTTAPRAWEAGRFAQVKEESAQRSGDTEQNVPVSQARPQKQTRGKSAAAPCKAASSSAPQATHRPKSCKTPSAPPAPRSSPSACAANWPTAVKRATSSNWCKATGAHLLPNTAGCHTAREAITLAHMARELFDTPWIKLEVVGDAHTLQPDPFALLEAATQLVKDGFTVFPYCLDDLVSCQRLLDAGCTVLMPWGAPIGSGQGLLNPSALRTLRARLPGVPLLVDAGIGSPMDAAQALQMGLDGVLLNSAVAHAVDPVRMARAFALAIEAGRLGFEAGLMPPQDMAVPSTPVAGYPILL